MGEASTFAARACLQSPFAPVVDQPAGRQSKVNQTRRPPARNISTDLVIELEYREEIGKAPRSTQAS
jgi:hypothetical protein